MKISKLSFAENGRDVVFYIIKKNYPTYDLEVSSKTLAFNT